MRKTEHIGFRASKQTIDRIEALRDSDCSVSEVIRHAIDFLYEYHDAMSKLLENKED